MLDLRKCNWNSACNMVAILSQPYMYDTASGSIIIKQIVGVMH